MMLKDFAVAADRADALASELPTIRPELASKQCFIREIAEDDAEMKLSGDPSPFDLDRFGLITDIRYFMHRNTPGRRSRPGLITPRSDRGGLDRLLDPA
jgi:hypothetical protein